MSEFEKECDNYGCPLIKTQWTNVTDLLATTEPKDKNVRIKEMNMCWEEMKEVFG